MALDFEKEYLDKGITVIVGLDEAGRGCLLGPVVAGAVILPPDFYHPLINDSKQLSEHQREEAYKVVTENALAWAYGLCSPEEVDEMNILNASREAMMRALRKINIPYQMIFTDYMKLYDVDKPVVDIVHGDARSVNVAAASIIAKVTRDHICVELEKKYPNYKIGEHKGYGTKEHLLELDKYGPIKGLHRFSYKPVKERMFERIKLF